ncbi:serine/arginine repetitive matrix protein 1, partial [Helicoverpa zea]|uniref:serine/arginine repetitive matrix protein 1 n=1 Tax=Helicoverpa zea TaxID=7113 RepID=UPI001F55E69D
PNARLYRPAPPRPAPPPAWPRAAWPPPAPGARLDTASRAALRLAEQRRARPARSPRRLVVTLPAPPAPPVDPAPRYRPASDHFRLRSLDTDSGASTPLAGRPPARASRPAPAPAMDADNRHSTSPEDCSEGNETLSAPSEFLAEFLSAIMRRQYAEALKYCRLILQYEPHNATARGFFPLLQHKVAARSASPRDSSSEDASARRPPPAVELMEQGADSSRSGSRSSSRGSCASQSSLELDSSGSAPLSQRSDSAAVSSGASRSEPDDNGNEPALARDPAAELRRLRARFTCSIK